MQVTNDSNKQSLNLGSGGNTSSKNLIEHKSVKQT